MDLTIGSLNFCVRSLGSIRLSDSTKSDPLASKTATIAMLESTVGSSSEGASSGVDQGTLTHRGRGLAPGCAALLCGALVAPLRLLFGFLEASVKFWATGLGFVQFQEYFLCNFSETQK
jgi:hypothetical protein